MRFAIAYVKRIFKLSANPINNKICIYYFAYYKISTIVEDILKHAVYT